MGRTFSTPRLVSWIFKTLGSESWIFEIPTISRPTYFFSILLTLFPILTTLLQLRQSPTCSHDPQPFSPFFLPDLPEPNIFETRPDFLYFRDHLESTSSSQPVKFPPPLFKGIVPKDHFHENSFYRFTGL